MFLVSNYPQVPIVTTNPATDSARQQAVTHAPVVPPKEADKSASERALDPEHERIAEYGKPLKRRSNPQEDQQEDAQDSSEQKGGSGFDFELWQPPTFDRPSANREMAKPISRYKQNHPVSQLSDGEYQRFTQVLSRYYQQRAFPVEPPAFQGRA